MLIVHHYPVVTIGDSWYEETTPRGAVDLLAWYQSKQPANKIWSREFFTMVVDLSAEEDMIFSAMGKTNRYKISRAAKRDNLRYECWNADAESVLAPTPCARAAASPANAKVPTPPAIARAGLLRLSR